MVSLIEPDELAELERDVADALARGDESGLRVLGHGEISLVLAWPATQPRVAAKRLPRFDARARAEAYGALVEEYLAVVADRGVVPVPSQVASTPSADGGWITYVVQPVLDPADLGPAVLAGEDEARARRLVEQVVDRILGAVDAAVGLDGQISNWADTPDGLRYLDVTTPLLADDRGRTRLDLALLAKPLPAVLRPAVRRFVAPGVVARYHRPRDVVVDLAANLHKERVERWIDVVLAAARDRVEPAVARDEVDRYYRADARLWEVLWRLRRADRWWQRTVRRRPYPTLLPARVER